MGPDVRSTSEYTSLASASTMGPRAPRRGSALLSARPVSGVGTLRFRPSLLPTLATVVLLVLLCTLGAWQLGRAEFKEGLFAVYAARSAGPPVNINRVSDLSDSNRYARADVLGRFDTTRQFLLDNRTHNGVAGYHVLTPFKLEDSEVHVLVNRGWLPVGPDRGRLPDVSVNDGPLLAEGLIAAPPAAGLVLGSAGFDDHGWPKVVQQVDLQRMEIQLGKRLLPFVVQLSPRSEHGYVRAWRVRRGLSAERHVGYAVQWFALAAALLALCGWVAVRRQPEDADDP